MPFQVIEWISALLDDHFSSLVVHEPAQQLVLELHVCAWPFCCLALMSSQHLVVQGHVPLCKSLSSLSGAISQVKMQLPTPKIHSSYDIEVFWL